MMLTKFDAGKQADSLDSLTRLARWCAYVSGAVSILGLVFLTIFFTVGGIYGPLNDIAVIVHYALMLPIAVKVHRLVRPFAPRLAPIATTIGIGGMLMVIILQALLLVGALPFNRQVWMVVPAFLIVLIWFVMAEKLGRHTDRLPKGILLHILAGLYIGYLFWAFSLGRRLMETEFNGDRP